MYLLCISIKNFADLVSLEYACASALHKLKIKW